MSSCRRRGTRPSSTEIRIGHEVQRDEIGARFFDRRVLLLQQLLRLRRAAHRPCGPSRARAPRGSRSSARRQTRPTAPRARPLPRRPAELLPVARRACDFSYASMTFDERHRLAAVLLANALIVRQVDADRRHRPRVAGFDDHFDRARGDAAAPSACGTADPRHAILEPLRVRRRACGSSRSSRVGRSRRALPTRP